MKKIMFFTVLLCVLSSLSFAKPYIPATDSEGTLLILKKYRDIFNEKYGINLTKNDEIILEASDNNIKAKIFLTAINELGYSPEETFDSLLDKYKSSFMSSKNYKSYPKVLAFLFEITGNFIVEQPKTVEDEHNISSKLREKIDFYLNFFSYLNALDENIIKEDKEKVNQISALMKKYGGNYLYNVRVSLLQYFGMLGIPQNKSKALIDIKKALDLSKKHDYLHYENENALLAVFLYDQTEQSNFTWSKANKTNSVAADVIAAHYALLHSDLEIIDELERLASNSAANDFSRYVSNMILLEIESGNNFYQNFVSLRDRAKANLVQGWTRKTALKIASKHSLAGVIFYCVAPKDKELEEILNNSNPKQKKYTEKFDNFLKSLNMHNLKGYYKYNKDKMATFNMKINSNNDSLSATISQINPKIEKHDTIKAEGTINRRPFAFNAFELDTKVSAFMYGRKMFLSLQPDGNIAGIDESTDAKIILKLPNLFLNYVSEGKIEEVKKMLNSGVDPNTSYYTERSAFAVAARAGYLEIVKLLFSKGININAVDIYGWSAINFASEKGHTEVVDFLINNNIDINNADNKKYTALMQASSRGYSKIVDLLLKNGANVNLQNIYGWTALLFACKYKYLHIAKKLIQYNANVNLSNKKGWTPLMETIMNKNLPIVNLLLNNGADVNALNKNKQSALVVAIQSKDYNLVKLLIESGVEVPVVDKDGWSTLQFAVFHGTPEIIRLLLENSANVNYERYGKSASNWAKNKSLHNMLTILNKADEIQNPIRSLHAVALSGTTKSLETLLKSKINLDGKNEAGDTALMIATQNGHTDIVQLLLANGANGNIKNTFGDTALKIATEKGYKEIVALLQRAKRPSSDKDNNFAQTEQTSQLKMTNKDAQSTTIKTLADSAIEKNTANSQASASSTVDASHPEIQTTIARPTTTPTTASSTVSVITAQPKESTATLSVAVAPAPKKPGKAIIIPTTTDIMSLTAFAPDNNPDSCIQVVALSPSPLTAVRLETLGGVSASWKTKDVKAKAQGVLAVMQNGKVINAADTSFALDVTKETFLNLCLQDSNIIANNKTRIRVIFFHQDGTRNYSIIER